MLHPTSAAIGSAYIGIPEASPLPKLLVDMHFFHSLPEWLNRESNIGFLRYLARKFLQDRSDFSTRTDQATAQLASCSYHCYGPENACYNGSQYR